jgi:hypothetical protein
MESLGFHGSVVEDSILLGYDVASIGYRLLTFQNNIPLSSASFNVSFPDVKEKHIAFIFTGLDALHL